MLTVFLREIEYYQGILFLTSNRVGLFDDAIVSRIHVVISFPDLNAADRKAIWEQFFDKRKAEKGKGIKIDERADRYVLEDDSIAKGSWNGREIRNGKSNTQGPRVRRAVPDYNSSFLCELPGKT
jgi:hypothetical protein